MKNSIAGILSAIEIHNKPTIKYRYEMVVLLVLNAWELLLKAYLYKYHKDIKLFFPDGTTKQFDNCLNITNQKIGKSFNVVKENLNVLYEYRNQVAHFYIEELDPIIYSLISKNIIFYLDFLKNHFRIDLSQESDLILLPIGFKRPSSPIDYISSESVNKESSKEVKAFLQTLVNATERLNNDKIEESIFVDFRMNLTNVNRITNADLIAGIDNSKTNNLLFTVNKEAKQVSLSSEGEKVVLTRNKEEATGTLYYEEIKEGIFDEINNIVDANKLLSKDGDRFMLGASLYYRIYSERQHVNYNIETFKLLSRAGTMNFYAPSLYWLTNLPAKEIVDILFELYDQCKAPNIHSLSRISIIIGSKASSLFKDLFEEKYARVVQKPDFFYSFQDMIKSRKQNRILKILKVTGNKIVTMNYNYLNLLDDNNLTSKLLSQACLDVFNGETQKRGLTRELDYLAYGKKLIDNNAIIEELEKRRITTAANRVDGR